MSYVPLPFISSALMGVQAGNRLLVRQALKGLNPPLYQIEGVPISAVVPTHNEEELLPDCITCIKNQTYRPIEVIVVDYESEDGTREIASSHGAKVVRMDEPGIGNARDLGAEKASSDFLFFTDADSRFENSLIEEMARELEAGWDVVTVPAVYFDMSNPIIVLGMNFHRFRAPWLLSGRATLTHRSVWNAVGGWELPYGEERYFGEKLRDAGYGIKMRRDLAVATSARLYRGESRAARLRNIIIWES